MALNICSSFHLLGLQSADARRVGGRRPGEPARRHPSLCQWSEKGLARARHSGPAHPPGAQTVRLIALKKTKQNKTQRLLFLSQDNRCFNFSPPLVYKPYSPPPTPQHWRTGEWRTWWRTHARWRVTCTSRPTAGSVQKMNIFLFHSCAGTTPNSHL